MRFQIDRVACVVACLCMAVTCVVAAPSARHFFDDVGAVKQHSFHAPLLEDFIESGFHAWSFGASAVVTNDYIRLTPAANEGHGYLWNHYHAELAAFRAHFSVKLAQRPHHGLFGDAHCDTCGVAMWALAEPVRHGEVSPFFGVPQHFSGIGVVMHQSGEMHLVAKESADTPATVLADVTLGSCILTLDTSQVDILLEYHSRENRMELSYSSPGGTPTTCTKVPASGLPDKYYFGFTAFARATSPVGYEVVGMIVIPVDGATERPIDAAEEERAKNFDKSLDREERAFWHETMPDADPRRAATDEIHRRRPDHATDDSPHHRGGGGGGHDVASGHDAPMPHDDGGAAAPADSHGGGDDLMEDPPSAPEEHQGDADGGADGQDPGSE